VIAQAQATAALTAPSAAPDQQNGRFYTVPAELRLHGIDGESRLYGIIGEVRMHEPDADARTTTV